MTITLDLHQQLILARSFAEDVRTVQDAHLFSFSKETYLSLRSVVLGRWKPMLRTIRRDERLIFLQTVRSILRELNEAH